MSNLGYGGKTHVLLPCDFLPLLFVTFLVLPNLFQPLSTSLMFCWVVGQLWLLVDGQLLPLGVGWQDCQSFAHIHTPPTTPCLPYLFCSPHAPVHCAQGVFSPQPVHSLTTILGLLAPHAQELGGFGLRQTFPWFHELLKHPRTVIRVLAVVLFIHRKNRSCFLSHRGLFILTQRNRVCIPVHFAVGCKFFLTHRVLGSFSHVVRAVLTVMFGATVSPVFC